MVSGQDGYSCVTRSLIVTWGCVLCVSHHSLSPESLCGFHDGSCLSLVTVPYVFLTAVIVHNDNFASLVSAVQDARAAHSHIQSFLRGLLTSASSKGFTALLGAALGLPPVLTPLQLLWTSVITDGLRLAVLGFCEAVCVCEVLY